MRMESEEEHTGRQMEANTQSGSLKHGPPTKRTDVFANCGRPTQRLSDRVVAA